MLATNPYQRGSHVLFLVQPLINEGSDYPDLGKLFGKIPSTFRASNQIEE